MAAMGTGAIGLRGVVEGRKCLWQILHDAFQLDFASRHQTRALRAVPLKSIQFTLGTGTLDDSAQTAWL
jgi:hypothetical protein